MSEHVLTITQVAELLEVSPITVRRMIWAGRLRSFRVGRLVRVARRDLEAHITRRTRRHREP